MKFFRNKFILFIIFVLNLSLLNSLKLKNNNSHIGHFTAGLFAFQPHIHALDSNDNKPDPNPKPQPDSYNVHIAGDLVTTETKPQCPVILDKKPKFRDDLMMDPGSYSTQGPYSKPNPYKIMSTESTSYINYLWDYLDEMVIKKMQDKKLSEIIQKSFVEAFESAKNLKKTNDRIMNFYTAPKLLYYFSQGAAGIEPFQDPRIISQRSLNDKQKASPSGLQPAISKSDIKNIKDDDPVKPEVFKSILVYRKDFNKEIWEDSITPIQLFYVLNDWGWGPAGFQWHELDIKRLVDAYDFNGDGNLNKEEFTIFQIHSVVSMGHQCVEHCFKDIIDKIIEPLFMYLDCDSDGFINSENMWDGFRYINRNKSIKYNMYQCIFPLDLNKYYRTNSVNDFILKSSKEADGYLNKHEFIIGILAGFWERLSDKIGYGPNSELIKGLKKRWSSNGEKDLICDEILYYFNN